MRRVRTADLAQVAAVSPPLLRRAAFEADVWAVSEAAVDAVSISFDPSDPHCVDAEQGEHLQHVARICGLATVCGIAAESIGKAVEHCVRQQAEVVELQGSQSPEFLAELTRRGWPSIAGRTPGDAALLVGDEGVRGRPARAGQVDAYSWPRAPPARGGARRDRDRHAGRLYRSIRA